MTASTLTKIQKQAIWWALRDYPIIGDADLPECDDAEAASYDMGNLDDDVSDLAAELAGEGLE